MNSILNPTKRKWIIYSSIALAVLGTGTVLWRCTGKATSSGLLTEDFAVVSMRSFPLEVVASGDLDAKNEIQVLPPEARYAELVIAEIVPEGTITHTGDVLCKFDTKALIEAEERLKLAVAKATTDLENSKSAFELTKQACATEELTTADKFNAAKIDLEQWKEGTDVQKHRDLRRDIETAQRELTIAQRDQKNNQDLFDRKFISQSDLEKSEIALINATEKLETTKLALDIYEKFTRNKELREKEVALNQAESLNAQAKKKTEGTLAQSQGTVDGNTQSLTLQTAELKTVQEQIKKYTVLAPQNGIVIYSKNRWFSAPLAAGSRVWSGAQLISLPDTSQMMASLRVNEAQIQNVTLDQSVNITLSARPGKLFTGKVVKKADTAEKSSVNPFLSEYTVKVELPKDIDPDLKPGMSCRGTIAVGEVKDALTVPIQAIFTEGSSHSCYVDVGGGKVKKTVVEIGKSSNLYAVVAMGLKSGEQVLLRTPLPEEIIK